MQLIFVMMRPKQELFNHAMDTIVLKEDYIAPDARTVPQEGRDEFPVENGYFVMGDNRGNTTDSLHCFHAKCYK